MAGSAPAGVILACILALCGVHQAAGNVKFVILHFNDFHAHIEGDTEWHAPCDQWAKDQGRCHGGIARLKAAIEAERKKGLPVLVLNAGDDFIGTHWDYVYKGEPTAVLMNQLGITVAAAGNHDFDHGVDYLTQHVKKLNYPFISANLNPNGHEIGNYIKPYIVTQVRGKKVGICAVTTESTNSISHPGPAYVEDHYWKARECVDKIRDVEGVNIIIMLSHEGFEADRSMAREIRGLDIVVGGHSHAMLCSGECPAMSWDGGHANTDGAWGEYPTWEWNHANNGKVPVVQAGFASRYLGRLEVEFDDKGDLVTADGRVLLMGDSSSSNSVKPDSKMEAEIAGWKSW
ncbi:unnamed protein product [Ostreobium quekettii]|uniref:Calcineurin-like phosphoesterase domain-containing protein n=1 Tax=Ostreobium quekettii TaxID=121088 RepID=A0A8S1JDD5_9CHLO|nr:unnamed protein product [Ostreobium quekettii]